MALNLSRMIKTDIVTCYVAIAIDITIGILHIIIWTAPSDPDQCRYKHSKRKH